MSLKLLHEQRKQNTVVEAPVFHNNQMAVPFELDPCRNGLNQGGAKNAYGDPFYIRTSSFG